MKLVRPHIPLRVRVHVIAQQLQEHGQLIDVLAATSFPQDKDRLAFMLKRLFGDEKVHLDHDPALCLREIIDAEKGLYKPDANDPRYLIYRTKEGHFQKTFRTGDGAQLSDMGKRRKEKRRIKKTLGLRKLRPSDFAGPYLLPRRLRSANRWPPRGSRPLRGRPL